MRHAVSLKLFGPPHLAQEGARLDLPANAPAWLLACLGVAGDWMPREKLALLFWPDAGTVDAQHHLRVTLHRSRKLLKAAGIDDTLQAERTRLRLTLPCDVPQFRAAVAGSDWRQAVALHASPLLGGQAVRSFGALDDWLARQRDTLQADWRSAALQEATRLAEAGEAPRAVVLLQSQLQSDLLAEDVLQALLRHAAAADARISALATYERFCERAEAELGLAPLPATVALADALRRDAPAPPPTARRAMSPAAAPVPLLGRNEEMAALKSAGPGLTLVIGEPGAGKTRLVREAFPDALWLQGREDWLAAPLQAVSQALGAHIETVRALGLSLSAQEGLSRLMPDLVAGQTAPPVSAESPALVDGVAELLRAWPQPVVIDDLQWLDAVSREAVGLAAGPAGPSRAPPARIVATLRQGEGDAGLRMWRTAIEDAGAPAPLILGPLPAEALADLVARVSGQAAPRFADWLAQRTGGNPFFVLECLATLDDGGLAPRWDERPVSDWAQVVPVRVSAAVQRRVERLGEATHRVLAIAAVAGDAQRLELLAGLAGLSPWATAQALAEAQAAGLLDGRAFAHGLVRDVLWQRTPEPMRAVLHAGVARRLAQVLPPHMVAAHWWAAGERTAAVGATLQAAELDVQRGLYAAADDLLVQAQARLAQGPESEGDDAARLEIARAFVARQRDDLAAAERLVSLALERLPLPATQQRAWGERFELAMTRGQLESAQACLARAQELNPELPTLWLDDAKLAHAQGDAERCADSMGHYVRWLRRRPPGADLAGALTSLGVAQDMQGEHVQAMALHREALAIARRIGARHSEVEIVNNLVVSLGELGRDEEAVRIGLPALGATESDLPPALAVNLAYSLLALGRLDEAERLYLRLAGGDNTSVACAACGKLLEIQARRGASGGAIAAAVDAVFEGLAGTEMYLVQVSALMAVLVHGRPGDAPRVLPWLRAEPLPAGLQERLDAALAARGIRLPAL